MTPRLATLKLLLIVELLTHTVCSGFAGFGKPSTMGGNAGKKRGKSGGFAKGGVKKRQKSTSGRFALAASSTVQKQTVTLGPNKSVNILVPPNVIEDQAGLEDIKKFAAASSSQDTSARSELLEDFGSYRGTGDVIWPSSLHLSRLVANCPSFVAGRRVLDLGCGLGLASLATLLGGPARLALSDVGGDVLDLAVQSCSGMIEELGTKATVQSVERMEMDWSDQSTWPDVGGEFDVVLASDVLYDAEAAQHVAEIISHLLLPPADEDAKNGEGSDVLRRGLVVDPANRLNRDKFVLNAAKNGLLAEAVPFPGQEEDFVLINITPSNK